GCRGITLSGCGAEQTQPGQGGHDGTAFKIEDDGGNNHSYGITLQNCYNAGNGAVGYWVKGAQQGVRILGCGEQGPAGSATASFKTDDGADVEVAGNNYVTAPSWGAGTRRLGQSPKPIITGSKAGNAALASLVSQLAAAGVITDNT